VFQETLPIYWTLEFTKATTLPRLAVKFPLKDFNFVHVTGCQGRKKYVNENEIRECLELAKSYLREGCDSIMVFDSGESSLKPEFIVWSDVCGVSMRLFITKLLLSSFCSPFFSVQEAAKGAPVRLSKRRAKIRSDPNLDHRSVSRTGSGHRHYKPRTEGQLGFSRRTA
jgi:hypothetical protein